jgi:hypothetical protein
VKFEEFRFCSKKDFGKEEKIEISSGGNFWESESSTARHRVACPYPWDEIKQAIFKVSL